MYWLFKLNCFYNRDQRSDKKMMKYYFQSASHVFLFFMFTENVLQLDLSSCVNKHPACRLLTSCSVAHPDL